MTTRPLYCAVAIVLAIAPSGRCGDNTWLNTNNNFVWSLITPNWSLGDWNNSNEDVANLGSSGAGTITLMDDIRARGIRFQANGYTLTGAHNLTFSNLNGGLSPGVVVSPGVSATIAVPIAGSLGLFVDGGGALRISAANTYQGGTTIINSSTLQVGVGGNSGSLGSGDVTISSGSTLSFNRNNVAIPAIANNFNGAGNINFIGVNTTDLSSYSLTGNNSSYSGNITLTSGSRLILNAASQLGAGSVTVTSGSGLFLNGGVFNSVFRLTGNGWVESIGTFGALRVANTTVGGTIVLQGNSRIAAYTGESGTISASIAESVAGSNLEKSGAGTVILSGPAAYTGNVTVSEGTLTIVGSGAVLPAGRDLTVGSGATLSYGNGTTIDNYGINGTGAIGALTLNNGVLRLNANLGSFYLNKLLVGSNGGSVDCTGAASSYLHFTGTSSGITVSHDSTWTGSASCGIQNDGSAPLPITINNGAAMTVSMGFVNGAGGFGYRITGNSYYSKLILNNPTTTNTADCRLEVGVLSVASPSYLGTGTITLAGAPQGGTPETSAALYYTGPTTSSSKSLVLDAGGGNIFITTPGTNLTLSGVISETGGTGRALVVYGDPINSTSVLTLTGANTYTGPTCILYGGVVSISTIANGGVASPLGASTSDPANLRLSGLLSGGVGTLRFTGASTSTDRGITLGSPGGVIDVTSSTLTFNGQFTGTGSLTKTGPGYLYLTNSTNNYSGGTVVQNGYLLTANVAALGVTTGALTLAGASLNGSLESVARWGYFGTTATTSRNIFLDATGGDIWVSQTGTTLTLNGNVAEIGGTGRGLTVYGDTASGSVLVLNGSNGYTGPTIVNYGGILSIPAIANGGAVSPIGASSSAPANLQLGGGYFGYTGTLRYTGSTASTDRGITLPAAINNVVNGGLVEVTNAATVLTVSGQITGTGSLTKIGPGSLSLANSTNNYSGGTVIQNGYLIIGDVGALGVVAGALTLNGGGLQFGGPSETLAKTISLGATGGSVEVLSATTTLTFTGAISGTGALTKTGPGALQGNRILTAGNCSENGH